MALRMILRNNESTLYKASRPVTKFDKRLHSLLDDMCETMYEADGAGLAAVQVGVLRRALVIDAGEGIVEMINPEIVERDGERGCMEGCLSFPGKPGYVVRAARVKARAQNRFGEWKEYEAQGLFARAIQHECDHLDGKVFLDLVTDPPPGYDEDAEEE